MCAFPLYNVCIRRMDISLYHILYQCLVDLITKTSRSYLAHGAVVYPSLVHGAPHPLTDVIGSRSHHEPENNKVVEDE